MPSRDYFDYDGRVSPQSVDVGAPTSTPWGQYQDFFLVKAIIKSERPERPEQFAGELSAIQSLLQAATDRLDARSHDLRDDWSRGAAAKKFFRFVGATLFGSDQWIEQIPAKIERLQQLAADISQAHADADALEQQFKAAYQAAAPSGAGYYGFPPDLSRNNPAVPDDEEAELKAQIAAIYEKIHKEFLKKIIAVGQALGRAFVEAATWVEGSAGKVPSKYLGPDAAKPWATYQPARLTPVGDTTFPELPAVENTWTPQDWTPATLVGLPAPRRPAPEFTGVLDRSLAPRPTTAPGPTTPPGLTPSSIVEGPAPAAADRTAAPGPLGPVGYLRAGLAPFAGPVDGSTTVRSGPAWRLVDGGEPRVADLDGRPATRATAAGTPNDGPATAQSAMNHLLSSRALAAQQARPTPAAASTPSEHRGTVGQPRRRAAPPERSESPATAPLPPLRVEEEPPPTRSTQAINPTVG